MKVIDGIEELRQAVGQELGVSPWFEVDQAAITLFADATRDHYFIHLDPERAKREAGLDGTIAHGLFTLSLGPHLNSQLVEVRGVGSALNYGYDKVRFTAPVPCDSRLRMFSTLAALGETDAGVRVTFRQRFEVDGLERPVCVADQISFYWNE